MRQSLLLILGLSSVLGTSAAQAQATRPKAGAAARPAATAKPSPKPAAPKPDPSVIAFTDKNGQSFHATTKVPDFVLGEYLYEGKGEPKVQLSKGQQGYFQPHMVAPVPLTWWGLQCDASGKPELQTNPEGTAGMYILVVRYGAGGGGNYPEGAYDRMQLTYDASKVYVLGEREKAR